MGFEELIHLPPSKLKRERKSLGNKLANCVLVWDVPVVRNVHLLPNWRE